jgi:hypothetical protein
MTISRFVHSALLCGFLVTGFSLPGVAQTTDAPYGSAKFSAYPDAAELKQLKVVWDFNFVDPKAVGIVFNNISSFLRSVSDFGPHEIDPVKVVVVSHGPEVVVFARKNYPKYKEIVDRAASFAKQGIKFEICDVAARFQGFVPEELYGFVTVVPAGPYALAYWQAKGYALNAPGATMPTLPISDLTRTDTNKKQN